MIQDYRPCAGIVLFDKHGRVFSGKRVRKSLPPNAPLWQFPQGGIDAGETPRIAALRELREETGITQAEIIYELPDWLRYDLPAELVGKVLGGKYRGQKQKWFAMRFLGQDSDIRLDTHATPEFTEWQWREFAACAALVVPFKRQIYETLATRLAHLAAAQ